MNAFNPYLLITPAVMVFLGVALLGAWNWQRRQRPLLWMALGILANGVALGVQSVLAHTLIAKFAIYTGVLYLAGAWLGSYSISQKFRVKAHPRWALGIALGTLVLMAYFSLIDEHLTVRTYVLNTGLGLLHLLPMVHMVRRKPRTDLLDTSLYWTYLLYCLCTITRPLTLLVFQQLSIQDLVQSVYWFVTLLFTILFYMAFAFLLLGSAIRSTMQKLQNERDLDPLTQLLNRRALQELVAEIDDDSATLHSAVIIGDIDYFKRINDTWGHDYGDHVLREVAQCLKTNTRSRDLVARFGGEEFVLLLPETDTATAQQIAHRIQAQLAQPAQQLPDGQKLTMSFGIAAMPAEAELDEAIKAADMQLYQAKQAGRNRVMVS